MNENNNVVPDFLSGGGEMGALMRSHDWAKSPLGPPAGWPQALRTTVRLLLNTRHPMYIWWGAEGTCLYNDAYRRSIGPERHPASLGRPAREVWDEIWHIIGPQIDQVRSGGGATWHENALVPITRHGKREDVYWTYSYSPIDDDTCPGGIGGVLVTCSETTAQMLAAKQLALEHAQFSQLREVKAQLEAHIAERDTQLVAQEALIRTFFDHSSECHAVLIQAENGKFRYEEINPATLALYGKTRGEVIGFTTEEVFGSAEKAAELNQHLTACLQAGVPYRYERSQGTGIVEAVATPVPDETGISRRLVVSARDVTDRRRLEEQLRQAQKMEAVGQLTGGIAHDFNNLLAGISGSLELLELRLSQGRVNGVERYIASAQGSARRAAALTQRLLAFSRRQTLDPRPTDVNRLVNGMEDLIRRTIGPDIALEVVGAGGLWSTAVDPSQLESSLLNLCINARDAMSPDGGRLTIETANKWLDERSAHERELPPGQYISLCVTDTGSGMEADIVSRAFDPFFTTKPLGEGTGLGLSMVYGFARQSGGTVRIYSELGKGTTMCLYLPRHVGSAEDAEVPAAVEFVHSGDGETVLVVDDEATVRMLIVEVLEENGYAAIEAADGPTGLRILQSEARVDLLITDVGLPGGMNGRQLADAARAGRPGLKILFITGYAENAAVGNGHLAPGMEILTKPFAMAAIGKKIRDMIDR